MATQPRVCSVQRVIAGMMSAEGSGDHSCFFIPLSEDISCRFFVPVIALYRGVRGTLARAGPRPGARRVFPDHLIISIVYKSEEVALS